MLEYIGVDAHELYDDLRYTLRACAAVQPVAFRDKLNRIVTVLYADKASTIKVRGLPAGRYEVSYTTATQLGFVVGTRTIAAGQPLTTSIPANGTLTVPPL